MITPVYILSRVCAASGVTTYKSASHLPPSGVGMRSVSSKDCSVLHADVLQ